MSDSNMIIQHRKLIEVNTDPQRRCYYGVHAKSEMVWTGWSDLDSFVPDDKIETSLEFWRDLSAYAAKERKTVVSTQYRAIPKGEPNDSRKKEAGDQSANCLEDEQVDREPS